MKPPLNSNGGRQRSRWAFFSGLLGGAAGQEVAQGRFRGGKGQLTPRDLRGLDPLHAIVLVADPDLSPYHARPVHHDHDGCARVGIHAEHAAQLDLEPGLLPRLAHRPILDALAPVEEAAGKGPLAARGLDGPPGEEDAAVVLGNGGGHHLVVQIEDEGAAGADHLVLVLGRHRTPLEPGAAERAEADAVRRELEMAVRVAHARSVYHRPPTAAALALTPAAPPV